MIILIPMSFIKYKERIDQFIRLKSTGSPSQFAEKIRISESMLYEYINMMKSMGAPIEYNWELHSYYYIYPVKFISEFTKIGHEDLINC